MTNKNKKYITDAMIYPNAGVLRVLLEYIDNMEKTAHTEGFDEGYNDGYGVGYNDGWVEAEWRYVDRSQLN